ncbi:class I SAM-dependent methyltransferase [Cellulomonas cellasea]|uniref:SAM-dependent methyltransferase n=1 Tax=Cellulomonas cellasea TaxID=43670 RepID=A0A7W4UGW4_9CELL|nr:class I SAM-dependent methyltransferase [Cellulomonas cellasea]MBB2923420.1 SAM-dependent methyltransferase [Cellulomonas cellasea]
MHADDDAPAPAPAAAAHAAADAAALWDAEADAFDEPADHGLLDPDVRAAWRRLLLDRLPPAPASVADLGCGTGTLSLLLADEGYRVDGVDLSQRMLDRARAKAGDRRSDVRFVLGDASAPPLPESVYDVVLCRHVLWALPDPAAALARWLRLLRGTGTLVLVEGRWSNGAGLAADETLRLVASTGRTAALTRLTDPAYWGRRIDDDRYVVASPAPSA